MMATLASGPSHLALIYGSPGLKSPAQMTVRHIPAPMPIPCSKSGIMVCVRSWCIRLTWRVVQDIVWVSRPSLAASLHVYNRGARCGQKRDSQGSHGYRSTAPILIWSEHFYSLKVTQQDAWMFFRESKGLLGSCSRTGRQSSSILTGTCACGCDCCRRLLPLVYRQSEFSFVGHCVLVQIIPEALASMTIADVCTPLDEDSTPGIVYAGLTRLSRHARSRCWMVTYRSATVRGQSLQDRCPYPGMLMVDPWQWFIVS